MRALLLAAGIGSRLAPLTNTLPKCMMPIRGYPLLEYWLAQLTRAGINEIVVNLHHHHEIVTEYIKHSCYRDRIRLSYEPFLLGTAGTIRALYDDLGGDPLMVIHADNLSFFDINDFIHCFTSRPMGIAMTMMTFYTDTPSSCGIVELDEFGRLIGFHEKVAQPPGNLANAAIFCINSGVIEFIKSMNEDRNDFCKDVIPHFLGQINCWHNDCYHRDIGTPVSYKIAQHEAPEIDGMLLSSNAYWLAQGGRFLNEMALDECLA